MPRHDAREKGSELIVAILQVERLSQYSVLPNNGSKLFNPTSHVSQNNPVSLSQLPILVLQTLLDKTRYL